MPIEGLEYDTNQWDGLGKEKGRKIPPVRPAAPKTTPVAIKDTPTVVVNAPNARAAYVRAVQAREAQARAAQAKPFAFQQAQISVLVDRLKALFGWK